MKKKIREVKRINGDFATPVLDVELKEDMPLGVLFGLDADGFAVIADQKKDIAAVGVVTRTSPEGFGEAFKLNGVDMLRAGSYVSVYTQAIVNAEEVMENGKVGDAVYLGEDGKFTLTKPIANTIQLVGAVANPATGAVRLFILTNGKENA